MSIHAVTWEWSSDPPGIAPGTTVIEERTDVTGSELWTLDEGRRLGGYIVEVKTPG